MSEIGEPIREWTVMPLEWPQPVPQALPEPVQVPVEVEDA